MEYTNFNMTFFMFIAIFSMVIGIIIFVIAIIVFFQFLSKNKKKNIDVDYNEAKYPDKYFEISKTDSRKFNVENIEDLKEYFFNLFLKFEKAYNDLDYGVMRSLSTKQLYNNYQTGISLDLSNGKHRVISDIEKKNIIIYELDSTTVKQTASVMIEISYINYILGKDKKVISGSKYNKITQKFLVDFRKDFGKKERTNCPNCGAKISKNKCEFCGTILISSFKISSIKKIK